MWANKHFTRKTYNNIRIVVPFFYDAPAKIALRDNPVHLAPLLASRPVFLGDGYNGDVIDGGPLRNDDAYRVRVIEGNGNLVRVLSVHVFF